MDQVKTHEEVEDNKTKQSTYFIRTVNCSCSKIPVIIKIIKMISIIKVIIIKCRGRSTIIHKIFETNSSFHVK